MIKGEKIARRFFEWVSKVSCVEPKLWSHGTVGFGEYEYKVTKGMASWYPMGFSPRKANISVHIMQGLGHLPEMVKDLGKIKHGRSCLYINKLADVSTGVLQKIISESWKVMRNENPFKQ